MPVIVSNIRIGLNEPDETAFAIARKRLKISSDQIASCYFYKRSLDARRRNNICFVISVVLNLHGNEQQIVSRCGDPQIVYKPIDTLDVTIGCSPLLHPIVVVGMGPAGLFCAYLLAKHGYRPVLFERGGCMEERANAVDSFFKGGAFDSRSNVQFGEGGAGTFSDGKLTTRISDGRCRFILEEFVRHGAPKEILVTAKPHIGTDQLRDVLISMRKEIERLGGKIYFNKQVEQIHVKNGSVCGITVDGETIDTEQVVLAIGHSARDTFRSLRQSSIPMEAKEFSVGVRIEQLQTTIDRGLYGELAGHPRLPKGEYQLSHRQDGRCVYTFCMCPGGYVVPSCSEENTVVTNGMSEHARDGKNANAALVVSVGTADFGNDPFGGMMFQEELERNAFSLGGGAYRAPAMNVGALMGKQSEHLRITSVTPTYARGVTGASFASLFPAPILSMLQTGLYRFDRKLPGFSSPEGILTGPETRTSSPIRIVRDLKTYQSIGAAGLYPCGEGAGYAGGIMSAACDGIRVAQAIMAQFAPME